AGEIFVEHDHSQGSVNAALGGERSDIVWVWRGGTHGSVAEGGFVAVIIAIEFHRLVGWGGRVRRRPTRGQIETFATKDAEDIGLCDGSVDVAFGTPIVLGNRDGRARVI